MSNSSTSLTKWLFSATVSELCYDRMVVDLNIFDDECFSLLASKLVGYFLVVFTSLLVKLPQVLKIWHAKSGQGVSLFGQCLTMFTSGCNLTYSIARGHPISVWGEIVALNVQNLLILLMLLVYKTDPPRTQYNPKDQQPKYNSEPYPNNNSESHLKYDSNGRPKYDTEPRPEYDPEERRRRYRTAGMALGAYLGATGLMLSPLVPLSVHATAQVCSIPMTAMSKILQIIANYRNNSTGQLSALSIFSMNGRSFGRVFTHLIESGDPFRIAHYTMTGVLNSTLTAQVLYYNYFGRGEESKEKKEK